MISGLETVKTIVNENGTVDIPRETRFLCPWEVGLDGVHAAELNRARDHASTHPKVNDKWS